MENRFPETLRYLLRQKKTTHAVCAKAIGLKTSSIGMYCTGKARPPLDTLIKMADYFGVPLDYLITGNNPENELIRADLGLEDEAIENLKAVGNGGAWFILNTLLNDRRFFDELENAENLAIRCGSLYQYLIALNGDNDVISDLMNVSVRVPAEKMRDYFVKFFKALPKRLEELREKQSQSVIELHRKFDTAQSAKDERPCMAMIESEQ